LLRQSQSPTHRVYAGNDNRASPLEVPLTTLIAWIAIDQRGPSALYFATDSRVTWGSGERRWDVGRKLFSCKDSPDIFGYVGEVIFPSLVLGQLIDAADHNLLIGSDDEAESRHAMFVRTIKSSFAHRHNAPDYDFQILHATRMAAGMTATFRVWRLAYSVVARAWSDEDIRLPSDRSGLVIALGSGASSVETHDKRLVATPQGRTSRATFWAFCDALKSKIDPLSGGPPQLLGMYRTHGPKAFGILFDGRRYFQGLPLNDAIRFDGVEWRDEYFQRIDGETLQVIAGAQRHGRSGTR
jgi:hypothetical protein